MWCLYKNHCDLVEWWLDHGKNSSVFFGISHSCFSTCLDMRGGMEQSEHLLRQDLHPHLPSHILIGRKKCQTQLAHQDPEHFLESENYLPQKKTESSWAMKTSHETLHTLSSCPAWFQGPFQKPLDSMIKVQATRNQWDSSTGFDHFTWKYSPERSAHYFGGELFVWKNSCSPPWTITFRGLFFPREHVDSFGAFWFKYKPRLFTYSIRLKPRINRSISILRLTSLQSLKKSLTKSLCVSISYFSKSVESTEGWGWNCLVFVVPLHLLLVAVWRIQHRAKPLHRRALGAQKPQHSPGTRWMHYPHMVIPSPHGWFQKKKLRQHLFQGEVCPSAPAIFPSAPKIIFSRRPQMFAADVSNHLPPSTGLPWL